MDKFIYLTTSRDKICMSKHFKGYVTTSLVVQWLTSIKKVGFGGRMPLFFVYFDFYNIHTFIQSQYIHPSPFVEASLHILIACVLSGGNFPVGPSRESNSGLPYSKPTRCQLSHAAPSNWATLPHQKGNLLYFVPFLCLSLIRVWCLNILRYSSI